jgi:hypothetical protein
LSESQDTKDDANACASDDPREAEARKELENLLEFEIDRLESETASPGWTHWALMGSLGTVLWLALQGFETGRVATPLIVFACISLSLLVDAVQAIMGLDSRPSAMLSHGVRFGTASSEFATERIRALVLALRSLALLTLPTLVHLQLPMLVVVLVRFYYGVFIAFSLLVLILSYAQFPVARTDPERGKKILTFGVNLLLALPFIALAKLVLLVRSGVFRPSISEWRIAGLLVAGTYLVGLLARGRSQQPLLVSLRELRSALGFGRISTIIAKQRAEIAIAGMHVVDVVQNDLAGFLSIAGKITSHLEIADRELDSALGQFPSGQEPISEPQQVMVRAAIGSGSEHIREIDRLLVELGKYLNIIRRRVGTSSVLHPSVINDAKPIEASIDRARDEIREHSLRIGEKLTELKRLRDMRMLE